LVVVFVPGKRALGQRDGGSGIMKPRVVVFTQPDCPPCMVVKMFLTEKGVVFEERDITVDADAVRELTEKYGSHSTPTLVIGDEVMIGFNPERLDEILGE
jgi:glutaredoxin-like YruB-family protein